MPAPEAIRRPELVDEFRWRLSQARLALARTVALTDDELARLEGHQPGPRAEDAANELAAFVLSRLEGRERHELDEIDAAQARLEAGVFGVCERCHAAVPLARLRTMPATRFCVACQRGAER
jgi:DnaK suppressor protein